MTRRIDKWIARCRQPDGLWRISTRRLTPADARLLAAGLKQDGIEARVLNGQAIHNKPELLAALAQAFDFPDHFGHNWDALLDCLSDMHWLPAKGYVCILLQADRVRSADRECYRTFLEVCRAAAERWTERPGTAFFRLVESSL